MEAEPELLDSWPRLLEALGPRPSRAALATLTYVWDWCRAGVYVRVAKGAVVALVPFRNPRFRNRWDLRRRLPQPWPWEARTGLPPESWWCNAGLLCTRACEPGPGAARGAGVSSVLNFGDLLATAARLAPEADCEFLLNKRDAPLVRHDGLDPYGATYFGTRDVAVTEPLLPVLSQYGGAAFADELLPVLADYADAPPGDAFPSKAAFLEAWEARRPVAVFRGSATGCGCDERTNPRLGLLALARALPPEEAAFLDVRLTGRNGRLRKHPGDPGLHVAPRAEEDERRHFLSLDEQARCRLALYVEGYSAASRLGELLRRGFAVIMVETVSAAADQTFFTPWLRHGVHLVRCPLAEVPAVARRLAEDPAGSAELAWRGVLFHRRHLRPPALERRVAQLLLRMTERRRKRRRRGTQRVASSAPASGSGAPGSSAASGA